jgi:hypothetical protein
MSFKNWNYSDILNWSLFISVVLYIVMFVVIGTSYNIYSADFFHVSISETSLGSNPKVLGIPLRSRGEYAGLCVFFFFNSFLGVWNSVVVDSLFGIMVFDENDDVVKKLKKRHPNLLWIFVVYDTWRGARNFFNILGIFSNVVFFGCTTIGMLTAGFITKKMYLNREGIHLLKEDLNEKSEESGNLLENSQSHILQFSKLKSRR